MIRSLVGKDMAVNCCGVVCLLCCLLVFCSLSDRMGEPSHMNYMLRLEGIAAGRTFSFPYDSVMMIS